MDRDSWAFTRVDRWLMNWGLLQNSLLVASGTALLSVVIGFGVALFCLSHSRWRSLVFVLAIISLALPPFLVTNCWLHLLGINGVWKGWLPWNLFSLHGTVLILALMYWPIPMFLCLAGWRKLDAFHLEAEPLLRGSRLVRYVLIPSARTEGQLAAALVFILALNNFAVPAILQVKVLPAELWVSFNTTFDYRSAVMLGWPLVLIPVLLLTLVRTRSIQWPRGRDWMNAPLVRFRLGNAGFALSLLVTIASVGLGALLPLWQILFSKQTWTAFGPAFAAGKSALANSFLFASVSAVVALILAIAWARHRSIAILWLSFLIPGVVLGVGLIVAFNRPLTAAFYQSAGIVCLALVIRYLAPVWSVAAHSIQNVDGTLVDAARVEGASGWRLLRHAYLPQVMVPLGVGAYAAYLFCLWDVETVLLIIPPGRETVALRIFNLLHYGHNSQVNALCLFLLILAVLPVLLWAGYSKLRSWKFRNFCAAGLIPLLALSGCSGGNSGSSEIGHPVQSRLFSHVQIIGSRGIGLGQFNKPRSLTLDREDNLYVVDMTGRVQKFSPDGRYLLHWQMPQTDLGRPKGMGLDSDGNIIVIEPHYSRVNHFTPEGKLVLQWGVHGTAKGQLAFPRSVAINSHGDMYLSEFGATERVQHFSARGERFVSSFGQAGAESAEFNRPEGLAIDAEDNIYVADSCNHRVQVFTGEGAFRHQLGKAGSGAGEMSYPYDVRIDAEGRLFVCEFGNSRIQIFDAAGDVVEQLGSAGAQPGMFANPWSIALDSKGNLYVADSQNHRVQKFIRKPGAFTSMK